MNSNNLYSKMYRTLKNGKGVVLIRIVRRQGSAPRGVGSCCMVVSDGTFAGSIGGGLLEYRAIEKAKVLLGKKVTSLSTVNLTSKEIADEGMICGGEVEVFFEPIMPEDEAAIDLIGAVSKLVLEGGSGTLITRLIDGVDALAPDIRMLVCTDSSVVGGIPGVKDPEQATHCHLLESSGAEAALFLVPIAQSPELLLFGGGHISTYVAPLAKMIGFQVSVFDDRSDFANRQRFVEADEVYAMPYEKAFRKIAITGVTYVVIVTRGHTGDKDVLERVLESDISPAYIGMIGSVRKRDTLYRAMLENGISEQKLLGVHSPIGLDIGAETPEEIAISIIAEIIQVKSNRT